MAGHGVKARGHHIVHDSVHGAKHVEDHWVRLCKGHRMAGHGLTSKMQWTREECTHHLHWRRPVGENHWASWHPWHPRTVELKHLFGTWRRFRSTEHVLQLVIEIFFSSLLSSENMHALQIFFH